MPSTLIFHKRDETFQAQRRLQTMSETEKAPLMDSGAFQAERTRFELVVGWISYVSLANWWFQPLTHLSWMGTEIPLNGTRMPFRVQR